MQIFTFQLGPLGTNCYVVSDEGTRACAVVDPGGAGEAVARWLREQGLTPVCVLLTHGHFDHVGGVKALMAQFPDLPVYVHEADTRLTPDMSQGLCWTDTYGEGDSLTVGALTFRVLHTPGHTPGSVCLRTEDALLTGDTLFAGSCGRTDFPGGSWSQMRASLGRLASLEGDLQVLPGHGPASTLAAERASNPYMKEALT